MSSARKTARDAILAKVKTALPDATILVDPKKLDTTTQTPIGLLVCVVGPSVDYAKSEELSAQRQSESWSWEIVFLVPGAGKVCDEVADTVFEALRATLCPAAGWPPETYSGDLEVDHEGPWDSSAVGQYYIANYSHARWIG